MSRLGAFFAGMNPAVRGFLAIALVAAVVVVLSLDEVLATVGGLLRIAFFLAIAFFLFLLWRERREEIESWPSRAKVAFYGAAALLALNLVVFGFRGAAGWGAVAFVLVLVLSIYAMFRVWRERHTYTY